MKKFLIFTFVFFLVSCGNNSENVSSENVSKTEKNIKNICDSIQIWWDFENIQKNFGKAELLSSQKSEIWLIEVYLYGKIEAEKCILAVQNGKIETANYHQ